MEQHRVILMENWLTLLEHRISGPYFRSWGISRWG
jgi:hypothetical protein